MALELVTGYWGQNHVTAEQEADLNAGIFGSGFYVLPVGEKMRAEAVTSNQVRIFDGIFVGYGRQASIEEGGYENVTIENGTAGLLRNDMIVIKYNKDEESGIESVAFDVLKGQTGSTAQDPVPNNQDIRAGAFESEMPLYRVKLNGLAIEAIEPLFTLPKSIPELMQDISDLEDENAELNSALFKIYRYGYYKVPLISAKSSRDIAYNDILSALHISTEELIAIEASLFDANINSSDINIKNQPTDNRLRIQNNNEAAQDVYINLLIFYK